MTRSPPRAILLCLTIFATAASAGAQTSEVWTQRGPALVEPGLPKRSFGDSVAIAGSTIVVTSYASDAGTDLGGAAYVYERLGSNWIAAGSPLTLNDGISTAALGSPCALSGDYLIAGAINAASAYAFPRHGSTWGAAERLIGADTSLRDWWVTSVSVSGDTAVVGVPLQNLIQIGVGSYKPPGAYVFVRSGDSWLPQAKLTVDLTPSDSRLGNAVSISGDTTVVTAPLVGHAYVFTRTGVAWAQGATLSPPADAPHLAFGRAVVLSGDTLLISAVRLDSAGLIAGVVYEFVRTNGVWAQSVSAIAPAVTDEDFGNKLSFSGQTAIIGSRRAAYFFARTGRGWAQQGDAILTAASSPSVAVDGQYAVVGVRGTTQAELGTAYVFSDACVTDVECGSTAFCADGTCRARCQHDIDCTDGRFCAADGLCREPSNAGQSCDGAAEGGGCKEPGCAICSTGHCVDAVCCESACDGPCEACAALLTGGKDGSCLPIAADQDPDDECAEGRAFPASCLADGACDGKRGCRAFAKLGTACGETVCSDNGVTGRVCDGAGTCRRDSVSCSPYACSAAACSTSCEADSNCDPLSGYCLNGKCAEKKPLGRACKAAAECASESCSDAVCCESACGGPCESCAAKGSEGECVPVTGGECSAAGAPGVAGGGAISSAAGMAGAGAEAGAGDGGRGSSAPNDAGRSATACGCRVAGGSTRGETRNDLLALIGLGIGLAGARRRCAARSPKPRLQSRRLERANQCFAWCLRTSRNSTRRLRARPDRSTSGSTGRDEP